MVPIDPNLLLSLDEPAAAAPAGGGFLSTLPMLLAFVAIFYFIVLRPQQKEAKEHQKLVASLQKGDKVVTSGGVHGRIHEARADTLVLEISPNAYITVDREVVKRKLDLTKPEAAKAEPAKGS